jgi:S-adenosylmethionine:tRNA ribosyltransferase-isomerase
MTFMRTSLFDFDCRPSASPCGRRARATRRGCWWCGRARRRSSTTGRARSARIAARPGDALVVNDTRVIPARLVGGASGAGSTEDRGDADQAARARALARFVKPAKRLQPGDTHPLRRRGPRLPPRQLDATVEEKGRGRRGHAVVSIFTAPVLDQAIRALGDMPLPPYIAARRRTTSGPRRLPDHVRAQEGSVAAPTAGCISPMNCSPPQARAASRCIG